MIQNLFSSLEVKIVEKCLFLSFFLCFVSSIRMPRIEFIFQLKNIHSDSILYIHSHVDPNLSSIGLELQLNHFFVVVVTTNCFITRKAGSFYYHY